MFLKKFFVFFLVGMVIVASQSEAAKKMFDKQELTLYQSRFFGSNVALDSKANVELIKNSAYSNNNSFFAKRINIKKDKYVYLGGETVGIAFYTEGIFITDIVPVKNTDGKYVVPANDAGIRKGDYIVEANGIELNDISNLDAVIQASGGNRIKLKISRQDKLFETEIQPVKGNDDKKYRLGLWMRDSAAGLGTITYINPIDNSFVALGHSICDSDTSEILKVKDGRIVQCEITGVKKGENGLAGELKGSFGVNAQQIGTINENTKFGIKGTIFDVSKKQTIPLGSKDMIHEGEAYIYSDFENGILKKYAIEILHINNQTYPSEKGMVIKITDKELINKTGGIVQGLSGSPIIQDGKLIGAVTHVMIKDPQKGYGIFIENMLDSSKNDLNHRSNNVA